MVGTHALHRLRRRFDTWLQSRLPLADQVTLSQRNVYILPTRAGLMLGATLLVLLVASINYQLNLGYLLTFLLAGCSVIAMHVAHANLRGLTMHLIAPEPCFMRAKAQLILKFQNPQKRTRYGLSVAVYDADQWVQTDVPAQSSATVELTFVATQRGLHRVPALTAQTHFPLGTFRVWTLWRPAAQVLVYPQPETHPPPLPSHGQAEGSQTPRALTQMGEPDGIRPYRRGDTLKSIVWKKAAKTGELVSREHAAQAAQTLWLEPGLTQLGSPEAQLSRLCAWVLQAERMGMRYGLRLAGQEIPVETGLAHQQRCLRALALA